MKPSHTGPTAIAFVGYRNADEVRQCVTTLLDGSDTNFVVLICENGGAASFAELVAALSHIATPASAPSTDNPAVTSLWRGMLRDGQIIEAMLAADNRGYAGGVNVAIARLTVFPDWSAVWVLYADTQPDRHALSALVTKAASDPDYGIVGSRLVLSATGRVQAYGGRWRKYTGRGFNIGMHSTLDEQPDVAAVEREMSYVIGASMYVTRPFIEEIGCMTEDYFLYEEEVDWCLRRDRFKLGFAPQSIVLHHHGHSKGSSFSRRKTSSLSVFLDERNKHVLSRRFYPRLYPLIVVTTLIFTAQYLRALSPRNFLAALRGWWAGLRGETGRPLQAG